MYRFISLLTLPWMALGPISASAEVNVQTNAHSPETVARADAAAAVREAQVTDVWVAFKTHFDIGYTDTIGGVLRKYRVTMMENALKVIEQDRELPPEKRFAWMI